MKLHSSLRPKAKENFLNYRGGEIQAALEAADQTVVNRRLSILDMSNPR